MQSVAKLQSQQEREMAPDRKRLRVQLNIERLAALSAGGAAGRRRDRIELVGSPFSQPATAIRRSPSQKMTAGSRPSSCRPQSPCGCPHPKPAPCQRKSASSACRVPCSCWTTTPRHSPSEDPFASARAKRSSEPVWQESARALASRAHELRACPRTTAFRPVCSSCLNPAGRLASCPNRQGSA